MVDPIAGISLASSILTLAEAGYKISKRTIEFSRLLGNLPPDLQECSNLMGILTRALNRLQDQLQAEDSVLEPAMALHADLESLFNQCNQTATNLLSLLNKLQSSNSLSKAIQITRKEGEIFRIRNKLDQYVLTLLFVLEEHQQTFNEDLRNTVRGLRTDFYQFHQKLVEQMSHGFDQVETAVSDSKESLLRDVRPLIAANGQAAQTSNLRLLAGQQDLSQNLNKVERAFVSLLQNGEARLATRIQEQLTEHHAATRTLFQSVYNRQNDDLRAQMQLLYQEVTKTLSECEAVQKKFDAKTPNNHLKIKASFEFDIRNRFVALHISQGMEWVSTTVLFPTIRPPTWLAVTVPIPRFDNRRGRCKALDTAVRSAPVNFMIKQGTDQYHLIKIDLSEKKYDQNITKAFTLVYSDYRNDTRNWWPSESSSRLLGIGYVKYGSYSKTMQCFTTVERILPHRSGGAAMDSLFPSSLVYTSEYKDAFHHTDLHDPAMQEGYALLIEEDPDNTSTIHKLICIGTGCAGASLSRAFSTEHQETDQLIFLLRCLDMFLIISPVYFRGPLKKALLFALLLTFSKLLLTSYLVGRKDNEMKLSDLFSAFTTPLCSVIFPISMWLVDKYSVIFDWKDIHSLFGQTQKLKPP